MNFMYRVTYTLGNVTGNVAFVYCPSFSWAETKFLTWAQTNAVGALIQDITLESTMQVIT